MKRWYRHAGPGEFRGEGTWVEVGTNPHPTLDEWEQLRATAYLPIAWSVPDHEPVHEEARPSVIPNFVLIDGAVMHQKHKIAVPLRDPQSDIEMRGAAKQLASIIAHLIETGELVE